MSKKVMRYYKPKPVTPEREAKVIQGFQLLDEALGEDTEITEEEYKALRVIADKLKLVTDDVFDIVKENTDSIQAPLSLEDMTHHKENYEFCDMIRAKKASFVIKLDKEQNISGSKYFNSCNVFEGDIAAKIKRGNNPKAQNVKTQLDGVNRKRPGAKTKKTDAKKADAKKKDKSDKPS